MQLLTPSIIALSVDDCDHLAVVRLALGGTHLKEGDGLGWTGITQSKLSSPVSKLSPAKTGGR